MKKALELMKSSNSDFRTHNLRKKESDEPVLNQLKTEEIQKIDKVKYVVFQFYL